MKPRAACLAALLVPLLAPAAAVADACADLVTALSDRIDPKDTTCSVSTDLTTANAATTPADLSIDDFYCVGGTPCPPGSPTKNIPNLITPQTDRGVISVLHAPITGAVPGIQLNGRLLDDPTREARLLLRLPNNWNGKLVVAGASGNRSEFNGDYAWSDYVVQKGYAYASQNKGQLNLRVLLPFGQTPATVGDPLACRLNPGASQGVWVHFMVNDPEKSFTDWQYRIVQAAQVAREGVKAYYGSDPQRTYAVGTSNGGYQVRRAVEEAPHLFDGGVDWEGTFVDASDNNLLGYLPTILKEWNDYVASGYDPTSAAAQAIVAAGFPPDIVNRDSTGKFLGSFWANYFNSYYEVTGCQWQKKLDPSYDTYGAGLGAYDYAARKKTTEVGWNLSAFATTGRIKRPLITVAGSMDALLPVKHQARAYAAKVERWVDGGEDDRWARDDHRDCDDRGHHHGGDQDGRKPEYRYYEVQNGNHIEGYVGTATSSTATTFTQLVYLERYAQKAFDLLVDHVETGRPLPPSQCVPKGGDISKHPQHAGPCAKLFEP